ncbi:bifunctional methionine sulfoxide reductase B/A protein [Allofrancisella guangzhouensis]|uniref:Peptide methionine sulfoxide reductase MsrA n=1 Tax=Allofrancisella guangzhouensis TaxID=594679 RepID=A0A0A8E620_9GAMM|nr:bifunctional methionine sulfoxide reductase B/A protein [Allofrancisella guangzhouensis]AJC49037.1 methionine sulfoxide reductase [Allofrancisella guangzhouensis]MBK2026790.1 bifunctional methionine sulfoxide reductase B/A protein [Allofrancisella guangzhouensis]MBK2043746.1 bifunctional methionine sulfoxide reductase B/A protein [Allofrancisella guangzhouensis]MBK2045320.1 bifunctional methionine sulfoxide reductase B/A protein [Allofrancisella guangzhouensis]
MLKTKSLTPLQYDIIINKSTERPFTGRYNELNCEGAYICRNCATPLFKSDSKFISSCGWPSYDIHIDNNVKQLPDIDGRRTEILCNNCDGHLGHIFHGEGYTQLNTRYCVNSASVDFIPFISFGETEETILAAGCFWGVEYYLKKLDGVLLAESGYCGGDQPYPDYKKVCNGDTGYLEVVRVIFDKGKLSLAEVLKYFFEIHDFEQVDGQGPDIGEQYESAIFYYNDEQRQIASDIKNTLNNKNYRVATKIIEVKPFYIAEDYHLDYYFKKGSLPYCHSYRKIF